MLFNSIDFAIFLPVVFILYWFVTFRNLRSQNLLIVIASYIFYGWWDWRFLFLIIFSTIVDYFVGVRLTQERQKSRRKVLLWISIVVNIGFLGVFKYYDFFLESFVSTFEFFGAKLDARSLNIILPVGISFYTFQTLSYSIDVYKGRILATKDFLAFQAFVSFFPQLVAGPIERATNLLPQFFTTRVFKYENAADGMRQILWGLFKKLVIADNCAVYVDIIFSDYHDLSGSTLILGAILFSFQIYGDFSGYSDIAIGAARLFGFDLKKNFAFPYFSRDIAEFWRRWHISLSTWFRDYLYIPLGGSRVSTLRKVRNTFLIFAFSGFWHGANWTFIFWGLLNAVYFLPLQLTNLNRKNISYVAEDAFFPSIRQTIGMLTTFGLTTFAWIFFRSKSLEDAAYYVNRIFSSSLFSVPYFLGIEQINSLLILIGVFVFIEWIGRKNEYAIEKIGLKLSRRLRWTFYITIVTIIFYLGAFEEASFIYFQF